MNPNEPGYKVTDVVSIHGDEYYTYERDVRVIAENLVRPMQIWCPFDTDESMFPKVLREYGHKVINTCTDFFTTPPPEGTEAIISNPPFSKKKLVVQRISELGIPFVLILPLLWLNDGVPFDYGNQFMLYRKRIRFRTPSGDTNRPRTNCFVLSNGLLKQDFKVIMN